MVTTNDTYILLNTAKMTPEATGEIQPAQVSLDLVCARLKKTSLGLYTHWSDLNIIKNTLTCFVHLGTIMLFGFALFL